MKLSRCEEIAQANRGYVTTWASLVIAGHYLLCFGLRKTGVVLLSIGGAYAVLRPLFVPFGRPGACGQ